MRAELRVTEFSSMGGREVSVQRWEYTTHEKEADVICLWTVAGWYLAVPGTAARISLLSESGCCCTGCCIRSGRKGTPNSWSSRPRCWPVTFPSVWPSGTCECKENTSTETQLRKYEISPVFFSQQLTCGVENQRYCERSRVRCLWLLSD